MQDVLTGAFSAAIALSFLMFFIQRDHEREIRRYKAENLALRRIYRALEETTAEMVTARRSHPVYAGKHKATTRLRGIDGGKVC